MNPPEFTPDARSKESDMADLQRWEQRLRAVGEARARQTLEHVAAANTPDTFRDEQGSIRTVDHHLLARLLRRDVEANITPRTPDEALWHALSTAPTTSTIDPELQGPIIPWNSDIGIEVWTQTEFIALHAAWHLAAGAASQSLRDRAIRAARWHIENTQADNATNEPWAIHVFAILGQSDPEADMFAESLLHACQVTRGHADTRSSLILLDAAEALAGEMGRV